MKLIYIYVKNASCQYKSDWVHKCTVVAKTCKKAKEIYLLKNLDVDARRVRCTFKELL